MWRTLATRIGEDIGYQECGIYYLASSRREMAKYEGWLARVAGAGLETKLLGPKDVSAMLPGASKNFLGGLYTAHDGRAEPSVVTAAVAEAARRKGASLLTRCAVRGVETSAGEVSAVVTERGHIRCEAALVTAGMWSRMFLRNLGINFEQLSVTATVARIDATTTSIDVSVGGTDFAFRKRRYGGYSIAVRNMNMANVTVDSLLLAKEFLQALRASRGDVRLRLGRYFIESMGHRKRWTNDDITIFEKVRINGADPIRNMATKALYNVVSAFPEFNGSRVTDAWSGVIDVTPTSLPTTSALPISGLFLASGFSGHGFGLAPAVGGITASLIMGKSPGMDLSAFKYRA